MVPTPAQIRAQVAAVWDQVRDARVIAIRAPFSVETGETLRIGEADLPVARCDSVLEVRDRLTGAATGDRPLVLLTALGEDELGADVVARLAKRHLFSIEPWQLVKERFRARYVDPRLVQGHPWVARLLVEAEPEEGYPPAPSGFIQAELVWQVLFESFLGLPDGARDAEALLEWSLEDTARARTGTLGDEVLQGLGAAVLDSAGPAAQRIFACAVGPYSGETLAVGLAARVIYDDAMAGDPLAAKASGKLEARLGGGELEPRVALIWAEAAEQVLKRRMDQGPVKAVRPILNQADALLAELGATERAHRSRYLAAGYEQRLARWAEALGAFVRGKAKTVPAALHEAGAAVLAHGLAALEPARAARVEMAGRLARWLAGERARGGNSAGSFAGAAGAYREATAYVDWARMGIADGDPLPALGQAYTALWEAASRIRETENQRFADLLANWTETGSHATSMVPVEGVIDQVLAPLAQAHPVLLIVVDGMGVPIYRELQTDLLRRGWLEVDTEHGTARRPVIAALPTVTEVSRTSLLCGHLQRGTASDEKSGFHGHPALRAAGTPAKPPLLFHKGDLSGPESLGLARRVPAAIADLQRRVVGVVINAVDDHLAKGEQVRVDWTVHRIRPLDELLLAARDAGRAVVFVSDHGHVPERGTTGRGESEAERWREATGAPLADEVLLAGPRVLLGKDRRIIAPWSERVRYSPKKNGYHGGATPQEVVIPLGVFVPTGVSIEGWAEVAPETPPWWEPEVEAAKPAPTRPARAVKPKPPTAPGEQGRLFPTEQEIAAAGASAEPDWIDRLMASEAMAAQRRMAARVALPEERVRAILSALDERGGKMTRPALAKRLGLPPVRLAGVLSALRRLLNVEGYPVLAVDEAADTVELNRHQLFTQFGL